MRVAGLYFSLDFRDLWGDVVLCLACSERHVAWVVVIRDRGHGGGTTTKRRYPCAVVSVLVN